MSLSLQVMYPIKEDTHFDFDYYANKHMPIVGEALGQYVDQVIASKGIAGGPDVPPPFYMVATIIFENQEKLDAALANIGVAVEDIPNFTNSEPVMLISEVVS